MAEHTKKTNDVMFTSAVSVLQKVLLEIISEVLRSMLNFV